MTDSLPVFPWEADGTRGRRDRELKVGSHSETPQDTSSEKRRTDAQLSEILRISRLITDANSVPASGTHVRFSIRTENGLPHAPNHSPEDTSGHSFSHQAEEGRSVPAENGTSRSYMHLPGPDAVPARLPQSEVPVSVLVERIPRLLATLVHGEIVDILVRTTGQYLGPEAQDTMQSLMALRCPERDSQQGDQNRAMMGQVLSASDMLTDALNNIFTNCVHDMCRKGVFRAIGGNSTVQELRSPSSFETPRLVPIEPLPQGKESERESAGSHDTRHNVTEKPAPPKARSQAWRLDEPQGRASSHVNYELKVQTIASKETHANKRVEASNREPTLTDAESWLFALGASASTPSSKSGALSFAPSWLPSDIYAVSSSEEALSTQSYATNSMLCAGSITNMSLPIGLSDRVLATFRRKVFQLPESKLTAIEQDLLAGLESCNQVSAELSPLKQVETRLMQQPPQLDESPVHGLGSPASAGLSQHQEHQEVLYQLLPRITQMLPLRWCIRTLPLVCSAWAQAFAAGLFPAVGNALHLGAAPVRQADIPPLEVLEPTAFQPSSIIDSAIRNSGFGLTLTHAQSLYGECKLPPTQSLIRWLQATSTVDNPLYQQTTRSLNALTVVTPGQWAASQFWQELTPTKSQSRGLREPACDAHGVLLLEDEFSPGSGSESVSSKEAQWLTSVLNELSAYTSSSLPFVSLRVVSFAGSSFVTDTHLASLAVAAFSMSIEHLDLSGCQRITDLGIEALFGNSDALDRLLSSSSNSVRDRGRAEQSIVAPDTMPSYPKTFGQLRTDTADDQHDSEEPACSSSNWMSSGSIPLGARLKGLRISHCTNLTPLSMEAIAGSPNLPGYVARVLEKLSLSGSRNVVGPSFARCLSHLTRLRVLSLQTLRISAMMFETMMQPQANLEAGVLGQLEWLNLNGCYVSERDLEQIIMWLSAAQVRHALSSGDCRHSLALRGLFLSDLQLSVTDRVLAQMAPLMTSLTALDLSGARRLTDAGISNLFTLEEPSVPSQFVPGNFVPLEELYLTNAVAVTDVSFHQILSRCPSIRTLVLARTGVRSLFPSEALHAIVEELHAQCKEWISEHLDMVEINQQASGTESPVSDPDTLLADTESVAFSSHSYVDNPENSSWFKQTKSPEFRNRILASLFSLGGPDLQDKSFSSVEPEALAQGIPKSDPALPWSARKYASNPDFYPGHLVEHEMTVRKSRLKSWRLDGGVDSEFVLPHSIKITPAEPNSPQAFIKRTSSPDPPRNKVPHLMQLPKLAQMQAVVQRAGAHLQYLDLGGCALQARTLPAKLRKLLAEQKWRVEVSNHSDAQVAKPMLTLDIHRSVIESITPLPSLKALRITLDSSLDLLEADAFSELGELVGLMCMPSREDDIMHTGSAPITRRGLLSLHVSVLGSASMSQRSHPAESMVSGNMDSTAVPRNFISGLVRRLGPTPDGAKRPALRSLILERFPRPSSRMQAQELQFALIDLLSSVSLTALSLEGSTCVTDSLLAELVPALTGSSLRLLNLSHTGISNLGIARLFQIELGRGSSKEGRPKLDEQKVSSTDLKSRRARSETRGVSHADSLCPCPMSELRVLLLQGLPLVSDAALRSVLRWGARHRNSPLMLLDAVGASITPEGIKDLETDGPLRLPSLRCFFTNQIQGADSVRLLSMSSSTSPSPVPKAATATASNNRQPSQRSSRPLRVVYQ